MIYFRPNRTVSARPPAARHRRPAAVTTARLTAESALLGLLAGALVVAPWTRPGYLLLLDWVSGPHQALTPGLYGLDPAALDALPYRLTTHVLRTLVGAGATSWLMILAYFPIAAGGVSAIAGGSRWRRYPAALFACVNPFVVERIQAGHVPFLLAVALLGPMAASALHARRRGRWFAARPAGWYALAISVGAHAAWLGLTVLVAVALLPRPRWRDLTRTLIVIASAGCVYAYAAAVVAGAILTVRVGEEDLDVYATHPGAAGLAATVATLRGFWRGAADSSPEVTLGLLPALVLVAAAAAGLTRMFRRDVTTGAPLAAVTVAGLLLGAGIAGPLGPLYRVAFDVLPLFHAMREQQKWMALAMLGYAVGVGAAAESLAVRCRPGRDPRVRAVAAMAALSLAGMYATVGTSLVWGLGGSVRVSHYPRAWYTADQIMGAGDEAVLFLPWHQYQPFTFTGGRSVATPAAAFFRRPVLSSDAAELGSVRTNSASLRMAYLDRLVAAGGGGRFGRLIAPLGIRYVALARDRESDTYAWLGRQQDLRPVLRTVELDLYRVTVTGTGRVVSARDGDVAAALAWAAGGRLGTEAVLPGASGGTVPSGASGGLLREGSTRWRVTAGAPGWVVLPEEWSASWTAGDQVTRPTVAGTVAVRAGSGAFTVRYAPWKWLRLGLAASVLSLGVLLVAGLVEHRRELYSGLRRRLRGSDRRGGGGGS
ncbi:hypothetical protein [Actinoplanes awajinensis]|uniref:Membrane protein 6-pyruvoyl-tetrahydropterin synthase-related domain-containing protein n=1 Tax=Actinoplanes awajinensis subsp. mycoplanecinus TaxID=135947 RepID=A0A101JIW1_9ACTN|nr:hypothetical protein [Actinoplanes awajinensis]KUL27683.1 hypothetical protein ADL15_34600 [Actinoplanes awajinensis subsp. mycoplanecinus]